MTGWRRVALASIVAVLVLGAAVVAAPAAVTAQGVTSMSAGSLVACGDGPSFPLAALDGMQGAELEGDGAARRLARAATTGEAGYVPRGGWIRVLDEPDRAVFATWLHPPPSSDGPLLQVTVETDAAGAVDPGDWRITSAGFCWPRVVPPAGSGRIPWGLAAAAGTGAMRLTITPAVPVCADTEPVVVLTPERVSVTVIAPTGGPACDGPASPTLEVALAEPLGGRELLDGAFDPPEPVQPAVVPAPAAVPPMDPGSVTVTAAARPTTIAASHAITDSLDSGPSLVEVQVVDELTLEVTLTSAVELVLAGPPRLCLVGPYPAPDDAGLIDRCWGDPDPGAALGPALARDAAGRPILRPGAPVELDATIARGDVRCDYPPGAWRLEVVLTPLLDGHGWTDVVLPPTPLTVDANGLVPGRELTRLESRYCGMATRPPAVGSPAP